jgi:hypothetical protein
MKQFVFREDMLEARMTRRIGREIEKHRLISLVDLSRSLNLPAGVLKFYLKKMAESGSVKLLRPVKYDKEDYDYYHLSSLKPQRRPRIRPSFLKKFKNRAGGWLVDARLRNGFKQKKQYGLRDIFPANESATLT